MEYLSKQLKPGVRFFTAQDQEVKGAFICTRVNEKSIAGKDLTTEEKIFFDKETGVSECGQRIVYAGIIPVLYDKLVTDAMFWVQTQSVVKDRL